MSAAELAIRITICIIILPLAFSVEASIFLIERYTPVRGFASRLIGLVLGATSWLYFKTIEAHLMTMGAAVVSNLKWFEPLLLRIQSSLPSPPTLVISFQFEFLLLVSNVAITFVACLFSSFLLIVKTVEVIIMHPVAVLLLIISIATL